jgi:hypothetical protein
MKLYKKPYVKQCLPIKTRKLCKDEEVDIERIIEMAGGCSNKDVTSNE